MSANQKPAESWNSPHAINRIWNSPCAINRTHSACGMSGMSGIWRGSNPIFQCSTWLISTKNDRLLDWRCPIIFVKFHIHSYKTFWVIVDERKMWTDCLTASLPHWLTDNLHPFPFSAHMHCDYTNRSEQWSSGPAWGSIVGSCDPVRTCPDMPNLGISQML